MLLQLLANGIVMGAVYALVALGFALVYNTTRIFHIAYAVLYMFAPYMILTFNKTFNLPIVWAFIVGVMLTAFLSFLMEFLVYRPLIKKKASSNVILISSIGIMIVVVNLIAMFYGNETKILNPDISESIKLGDMILTYSQLYQLFISIILIIAFLLFLKFSKFGVKTRAIRDDNMLCKVFGLNINRMRTFLFVLSGIFAAVGGGLVAWDVGMDPYVGMPMMLNAVVALIIGGMGRFEAPIFGGFIIGVLHALTVWVFSARWQDAVTFSLLILFLIFRPQGLLGEKKREV